MFFKKLIELTTIISKGTGTQQKIVSKAFTFILHGALVGASSLGFRKTLIWLPNWHKPQVYAKSTKKKKFSFQYSIGGKLANFNAFVYCWWTSGPSRFNVWLSKQLNILGNFHVEEIWTRCQQNANTSQYLSTFTYVRT